MFADQFLVEVYAFKLFPSPTRLAMTIAPLTQDILYRRTVAFCCRGLRFLCSGPCCTKRDDERNGKTNGLSQLDQAEAGRVVPKIKAKNTEDRDDRPEKRGRSSTTISSPSPPARSSAANEVLAPPSTPTAAYFKQIHTPDRPPRPGRKAAEEKLKDSKKHKKTGSSKPSRGSSASRRRKLSRSLTRKVMVKRIFSGVFYEDAIRNLHTFTVQAQQSHSLRPPMSQISSMRAKCHVAVVDACV